MHCLRRRTEIGHGLTRPPHFQSVWVEPSIPSVLCHQACHDSVECTCTRHGWSLDNMKIRTKTWNSLPIWEQMPSHISHTMQLHQLKPLKSFISDRRMGTLSLHDSAETKALNLHWGPPWKKQKIIILKKYADMWIMCSMTSLTILLKWQWPSMAKSAKQDTCEHLRSRSCPLKGDAMGEVQVCSANIGQVNICEWFWTSTVARCRKIL